MGQPVEVAGSWLPDGTVFVSGREHDGMDGFWMVTPLAVGDADDPALPVVLGWVADPDGAPAPPEGEATLVGWLQPPEGTGARDDDPTDDVLTQLRIADIVQHVDQDLYGAYAIEWWFFGAFAVLIWWRWVGEMLAPKPDDEPDAADDEDEAAEDEEQPDTVRT